MPIKAYSANWEIESGFGNYNKKCVYEIQYSASRSAYRIKCSGYKPKEHKFYPHVVDVYFRIVFNHTATGNALAEAEELLRTI